MKILVKHSFKSFRIEVDEKSKMIGKFTPHSMSIGQLSKKLGIDTEKTHFLIRKLNAYGFINWTNTRTYFTQHQFSLTNYGYIEFQDGWKRYVKELLLASAASGPFVTIVVFLYSLK